MHQLTITQITPEELEQLIEKVVRKVLPDFNLHENTPPKEVERALTLKEAADFLNLAMPTVYGLTSKKLVPFMKKGKRLYFSKSHLIEWLESGRNKTVTEIEAEAEIHLGKMGEKHL